MAYRDLYTPRFAKNYQRYANLKGRVDRVIEEILADPYQKTEALQFKEGRDLRGLRSARIGRNFRVIFTILEELKETSCEFRTLLESYLKEYRGGTVVFLTVGPHAAAYRMK